MSLLLACVSVGVAGWILCANGVSDYLGDDAEVILATLLFVSGFMQGIGTFGKRRKLRQIGLVLSGIGLICIGGLLVGSLFGVAVLLLVLGFVNVYPLLKDVMGKPRAQ